MRSADMYQELYCKYCNKMCHSLNSVRVHETYCSNNPKKIVKIGHKSWNKGLTKDLDERVLKNSINTSNGMKKVGGNHQRGKPRTEEEKKKISRTLKNNPNVGGLRQGSGRGKKGWYKGFFCDSTYELAFIIYCLEHNIKIERCSIVYEYTYNGQVHKYHPDFILEDGSLVEIKGYMTDLVNIKLNSVNDRKITLMLEKDLKYALDYAKIKYGDIRLLYEHKLED